MNFAWIALVTWIAHAQAATLAGIELPDMMKAGEKTLTLNGIGIRQATIFKIDVYVAGLYLESKSSDANAVLASKGIKHMEMRFMRSVSQKQIADTWGKGMKANCTRSCDEVLKQLDQITAQIPEFSKGDTLSIRFSSERTEISARGKPLGSIQGEAFGQALLAVWLGASPPSEDLKKSLLSIK
jgi:hypothetical protein